MALLPSHAHHAGERTCPTAAHHRLSSSENRRGGLRMKWDLRLAVPLLLVPSSGLIAGDVLQHHANPTRDGLYVEPILTQAAAGTIHRDTTFSATLPGPVYAQP